MIVVPPAVPLATALATKLFRPMACLSGAAATDGAPPLVAACASTSWPMEVTINGFLLFDACVATTAILTAMLVADVVVVALRRGRR